MIKGRVKGLDHPSPQEGVNSSNSCLVSCNREKYQDSHDSGISGASVFQNFSIFSLPGHGEAGEFCGEPVHAVSCPNFGRPMIEGKDHDRFIVLRSCRKADCPVCYEGWAAREGNRASERIIEAQGLYKRARIDLGMVKHVMLSPPQEYAKELIRTLEGYIKLRREAIELLKGAGVRGGAVVFHPFRQNDPREDNFDPMMPSMVWYVSPHFHVIGCGYLEKSDVFHQKTGWVYKNIGRRETIAGTIIYVLTHCGIYEGLHSLTWFGVFSYNKIVIDKEIKTEDPVQCSVCGEDLHEFVLCVNHGNEMLEADWQRDIGVYYHVSVKRTYKIRGFDPPSREASSDHSHDILIHPELAKRLSDYEG